MNSAEKKYIEMTAAPFRRLIVRLAVPMVVCMLMTGFYNMVDTFFVGQLGKSATAAVGIAQPVMTIITAIGYCFGNGGGTCLSNRLGERNRSGASAAASSAFFLCFGFTLLVGIAGLCFRRQLVPFLGATDTIAPYASEYLLYIFCGMAFSSSSMVLSNILRYQGSPGMAMIASLSGGLLNVVLDPIFIFTLGMGVGGAALATVISQIFGFCLMLAMCLRTGIVELRFKRIELKRRLISQILRLGLPTFFRQFLTSLSVVILNYAARPYGDGAIAAITIASKVVFFFQAYSMGFGQGYQPFCAYNFGARCYDRVYKGLIFSIRASALSLAVLCIPGFLLAEPIAALFSDEHAVIEMAARTLRFFFPAVPFIALMIMLDMCCQTLGQIKKVLILAFMRQGVLLGIFALGLPVLWDFTGVQLAQVFSEMSSLILALILCIPTAKKLKNAVNGSELRL